MKRIDRLTRLRKDDFDILIIGGGASGLGSALDAASRGLKVALIERDDYASGTSSKSSKLVHGGVRYLEIAVKQRDPQQLQLVRDALHERAILKRIAPNLVHELRLLTPCKNRLMAAYFWFGLQLYDALAGHLSLTPTHFLSNSSCQQFSDDLHQQHLAAMVAYSDAQFDDAAMSIALMETAQSHGACLVNYCSATATQITQNGSQVEAYDHINEESFSIKARCVINCSGANSDTICGLDNPDHQEHIQRSIGAHIVVDRAFWPHQEALLIPETDDGRVLFIIPWQGSTLIGTTDETVTAQDPIFCSETHKKYLLENANRYLTRQVHADDILSSWAGIRPLLKQSDKKNSSKLIRDHRVIISKNGLISLCGGKWTTYRLMAKDCIDTACEHFCLSAPTSKTHQIGLIQAPSLGGTAQSLNIDYLCRWSLERCHAEHIDDILARRSRLAFTDIQKARASIPAISMRMQAALGWTDTQTAAECARAEQYLDYAFTSYEA